MRPLPRPVQHSVMRACGCGPLPRPLITGRDAERPSPESRPLVAASGPKRSGAGPSGPRCQERRRGTVDPRGRARHVNPDPLGVGLGGRSTAGVGSRARSSPLPSGPPSVRPFVRQSCVNTALHPQKQVLRHRRHARRWLWQGRRGLLRGRPAGHAFRSTWVRVDPCSGFTALCSGAPALDSPSPVPPHTGADFCNTAVSVARIDPHL